MMLLIPLRCVTLQGFMCNKNITFSFQLSVESLSVPVTHIPLKLKISPQCMLKTTAFIEHQLVYRIVVFSESKGKGCS